jgi:hypothetical protein
MQALLELADAMWTEGRANGGDVDYARFEEDVAKRTAEVECAVHEVALSGLDVVAPFVTVWGKTYRRVHRTTRQYGTLAGNATVERTLYREVACAPARTRPRGNACRRGRRQLAAAHRARDGALDRPGDSTVTHSAPARK